MTVALKLGLGFDFPSSIYDTTNVRQLAKGVDQSIR